MSICLIAILAGCDGGEPIVEPPAPNEVLPPISKSQPYKPLTLVWDPGGRQ